MQRLRIVGRSLPRDRTRALSLPLIQAPKETPLLRLLADSFLVVTNGIRPTSVSLIIHGITRDGIWLGKAGSISLADVFRIFPMGQSPLAASLDDYTPGFPIARFAVTAAELKGILDMSINTSFGSTEGIDYFMMPAGMRYEFSTGTSPYSVTKLIMASNPANPENFDTVIYDEGQGGWLVNPLATFYSIAADYDVAMFAKSKGVNLRNPENLNEIYPSPPLGAIVKRPDGTEQKSYEALAAYIYGQCLANGYLPNRYNDATAQRVICYGANCIR